MRSQRITITLYKATAAVSVGIGFQKEKGTGVLKVSEVYPDGLLHTVLAGRKWIIKKGDELVAINGRHMETAKEAAAAIKNIKGKLTIQIWYENGFPRRSLSAFHKPTNSVRLGVGFNMTNEKPLYVNNKGGYSNHSMMEVGEYILEINGQSTGKVKEMSDAVPLLSATKGDKLVTFVTSPDAPNAGPVRPKYISLTLTKKSFDESIGIGFKKDREVRCLRVSQIYPNRLVSNLLKDQELGYVIAPGDRIPYINGVEQYRAKDAAKQIKGAKIIKMQILVENGEEDKELSVFHKPSASTSLGMAFNMNPRKQLYVTNAAGYSEGSNLTKGDIITSINGVSTENLSNAGEAVNIFRSTQDGKDLVTFTTLHRE